MKKLLSILGAIGLPATSTTSLISCKKPNNNENGGGNKPKPNKPQEPPENSSWKITDNTFNDEFKTRNNKFYIMSAKEKKEDKYWKIIKFKNDDIDNPFGNVWNNGVKVRDFWYIVSNLYRWDGTNEPQTPDVDKDTGKIIDWKE
ncbi:MAG: hypothetical protein SPLM_10640 [Spiroplasma phoeniceum]|uniref:lipoprotein n=1 Tax=Spiroplasma phoeniceum TaxID=47835 RepID=UPI003134040A